MGLKSYQQEDRKRLGDQTLHIVTKNVLSLNIASMTEFMYHKKYILIFLLACSHLYLSAQSFEDAKDLFLKGNFEKALPVFQQEYEKNPTDLFLNFGYGVCLYKTDRNIKHAEDLLLVVTATKKMPDAHLYLGEIYAKTYRLDMANKEYATYAMLKRRDKSALTLLEEKKEYVEFLGKEINRTEDVQIIDSMIVDKESFLSAYNLSVSSGKIDKFNNVFKTDNEPNASVYINERGNKLYYAYADTTKIMSLFSKERLLNGLGNEKKLSDNNFNLSGNLNYPYVLTDGETMYFSAQDKEGLGGYDLYVTRYNSNTDTYLAPERLSMPFNSLYNDFCMVIDEEKNVGWFATDRFQNENNVCVYTFIPNKQVELVESNDLSYKSSRAKIESIKDTWRKDQDYKSLIAIAREGIEPEKIVVKDFEFVINDQYTYYTYADFKDEDARNLVYSINKLSREYQERESELNQLREQYRTNSSLSNSILLLEKKQSDSFIEIQELTVKARNQEIKYLTK